jgi:hypothetical protein
MEKYVDGFLPIAVLLRLHSGTCMKHLMVVLTQDAPIDIMNIPPQTKGLPPYKIIIKPRSEAHRQLVLRECKAANDDLHRKS